MEAGISGGSPNWCPLLRRYDEHFLAQHIFSVEYFPISFISLEPSPTRVPYTYYLVHNKPCHIHEIEAGKKQPTAELVVKVARLFQVTTDQLLLDGLSLKTPQRREPPQMRRSAGAA